MLKKYRKFYVIGDGDKWEGAYFITEDKAKDFYNKRKDTIKITQLELFKENND